MSQTPFGSNAEGKATWCDLPARSSRSRGYRFLQATDTPRCRATRGSRRREAPPSSPIVTRWRTDSCRGCGGARPGWCAMPIIAFAAADRSSARLERSRSNRRWIGDVVNLNAAAPALARSRNARLNVVRASNLRERSPHMGIACSRVPCARGVNDAARHPRQYSADHDGRSIAASSLRFSTSRKIEATASTLPLRR